MKREVAITYAVFVSGVSIGLSLSILMTNMPLVFSETQINITRYDNKVDNITIYNCSTPIVVYTNKPEWLQVVEEFHLNKEYSQKGYNCRFYSAELMTILRNMGYDAEMITGKCDNMEYNHAWVRVCVDYEPQSGMEVGDECREN